MPIAVISTGGTIASTDDSGGDASPELTGSDLVDAVPGLGDIAEIVTEDFSNVPSPHFTVKQMFDLAERVRAYDEDPSIDGVVITQGTDILEESAYFVDCCYGGETPVVFTGAMRNPTLASPDGPGNMLASVRTAKSDGARGLGALVVFNDRVAAARDVTKMNSMNPDTFRSPEFGPLASVDEDRVRWQRRPGERTPDYAPDPAALDNEVHALTATADMSDHGIRAAADAPALCLAATGAGHIPPGIIPALEDLREAGVPIIATTRCPEGRLARRTYDFPGSEATLRRLDCHFSDRNLQKTRIETIVALAADSLDEAFIRPD
ncbi:asparaginase [Haloarcula sp. JP-L23]|uniref:asparaginase n=1 Tax=Haloarcula sp. JP-L23 TaxID=2716717 RepID=UPI00140EE360|nr:asparaginase [Haloarcula sp. JP-L23]